MKGRPWLKQLAYVGQAILAYPAFFLVRLIPLDLASALGGWLGRTVGPWLAVTRRARRNLARAFPEKKEAEIEAIVKAMWDNLGRTSFEFPHLDRLRFAGERPHVEMVGRRYVDLLRDDGRPGIFFSGHLANWEVAALGAIHRGVAIHLVYRAPNNPLIEGLFHHRQPGQGELIRKGASGARRALQLLKAGGHVGMLVDQKMNDGIPVKFFGRAAMTAPALAQFALRYRCPVIPARVERLDGARFRITVHPPLEHPASGDRARDVAAMMADVNLLIEGWVRERPEQWLWIHNRWPD